MGRLAIGDYLHFGGRKYMLTGFRSKRGKQGWILQADNGRLRFFAHAEFMNAVQSGAMVKL